MEHGRKEEIMNKANGWRLVLLLAVLVLAAWFPIGTILKFEYPEVPPQEFLFRTGALDPYDSFRGRYVTLNPMPNTVSAGKEVSKRSQRLRYAVLARGEDGFAEVTRLTEEPPSGEPFVRVHNVFRRYEWRGNRKSETALYQFSFPFNRFYLNEKLAPEAEALVTETIRKNADHCVLSVLVYADGSYAVKDLLIRGTPLLEVIREKKRM